LLSPSTCSDGGGTDAHFDLHRAADVDAVRVAARRGFSTAI
jgi:hypothetical protein